MIDLRQTPEYAKYLTKIGWVVERQNGINYFIRKLWIFGSIIKIQRPERLDFDQINRLAKKYRTIQIIIEPTYSSHDSPASQRGEQLSSHNFRLSKSPFLPSKTLQIDLSKNEKQLLKEMHYKTRYNIKKSHNSILSTHNSNDFSSFADFWQECAFKQRGMFLSQKKEIIEIAEAFGKKAHLLVAEENTEVVAGLLVVSTGEIAYYMYAASSDNGKKLFAPTLLTWEAIKLCKKLKYKILDFEGIYDERFPIESWKGFSRFKKSFGGNEVEFPGAFTKWRLPL